MVDISSSSENTVVVYARLATREAAVLAKVLRRLAVPAGDPNDLLGDNLRDLRDQLKEAVDILDLDFYNSLTTRPSQSGKGLRLDVGSSDTGDLN